MDDSEEINISWHVDDVLSVRPDLSRDEALKVLKTVKREHNAEVGVNWDVIETVAFEMYPLEAEDETKPRS